MPRNGTNVKATTNIENSINFLENTNSGRIKTSWFCSHDFDFAYKTNYNCDVKFKYIHDCCNSDAIWKSRYEFVQIYIRTHKKFLHKQGNIWTYEFI